MPGRGENRRSAQMRFYLRVRRLSLPTFVRISGPPQKSIPTSMRKSQTSCPRLPRSSPSTVCVWGSFQGERRTRVQSPPPPPPPHTHTPGPLRRGCRWEVTSCRTGVSDLPPAPPRPRPHRAQAPPHCSPGRRISVAAAAGLGLPGIQSSELCSDAARSDPAMDRKVAREFRHKVRAARDP